MNIYAGASAVNTPAHILYNHWARVLDEYTANQSNPSVSIYYGHQRAFGIGAVGNDANGARILGYGWTWGPYSTVSPLISINSNGEFRFAHLHGWKNRDMVARETFLTWEYDYSAYNWLVDLDREQGYFKTGILRNRAIQRHYVAEKVMGLSDWRSERAWMKLVPTTDDAVTAWKMDFAWQAPPQHGSTALITQADFDKFDALRNKRYERLRRQDLIAQGLMTRKGRVIKTDEELLKERAQAAATLGAHFQVVIPARTNSLRKKEEEGLWPPNGCP